MIGPGISAVDETGIEFTVRLTTREAEALRERAGASALTFYLGQIIEAAMNGTLERDVVTAVALAQGNCPTRAN